MSVPYAVRGHEYRKRLGFGPVTFLAVLCSLIAAGVGVALSPQTAVVAIAFGGFAAAAIALSVFRIEPADRTGVALLDAHATAAVFVRPRGFFYAGLVLACAPALSVAGSQSFADLFFGAAALLALWEMLAFGRRIGWQASLNVFISGLVMLAIGGLVAAYASANPGDTAKLAFRPLYAIGAMVGLAPIVLRSTEHVRKALGWWVTGVAVACLFGLLQAIFSRSLGFGVFAQARASGLTLHPDDLGSIAGITTIPAFYLYLTVRGRWRRIAAMAAVSLALVGIIVSGSIGGLIALVVSGATWLALDQSRTRAFRTAVAIVAAVIVATIFVPTSVLTPTDRISKITSSNQDVRTNTAKIRANDWQYAIRRLATNPVRGVGLDNGSLTPAGDRVQNMLLEAWFESGLIGLLGAILIFASPFAALAAARRLATSGATASLTSCQIAVFAGLIFLASEQIVYYKRLWWIPLALLFATEAAIRRESQTPPTIAAD
jgi:O-antigen ligase